jgi:hypothetical protein
MTRRAHRYFEFSVIRKSIREEFGLHELGPQFEEILDYVAIKNHHKARLSVKDLMSVRNFGSPATIHTRLQVLRDYGWIELEDTGDRRRKQVVLSASGMLYFDRLGRAIHKISESKNFI